MKRLLLLCVCVVAATAQAAVVQPVGTGVQVLIPAAGSTAGANGTFFRSDMTIVNLANHDQRVLLQWVPQAGPGATSTNATLTLPALSGLRSPDFVNDYLHQTGLGAIILTGITTAGLTDTTARLYVNARIWSPQPGANGTVSQSFPAIPVSSINTQAAALLSVGGADNPANYRVNLGLVNLDPVNAQTFFISLATSGVPEPVGQTLVVPAMTMQQISLGSNVSASARFQVQNVTPIATRSNAWTAYSSTVDNATGDAWSEIAVAGTTP
jgi:hypothetical protein